MNSGGRLEFEVGLGPVRQTQTHGESRDPDEPMRVLVLADFSGRERRSQPEPLASRPPVRVDIDRLDDVFAGFKAGWPLPARAGAGELHFTTLEDFHPDQFIRQIGSLRELIATRRGLASGDAAAAGAKLQQILHASGPASTTGSAAPTKESNDDTLARLIGKSPGAIPEPTATPVAGPDFKAIIHQIIGTSSSHVPAAPAGVAGLAAAADLEITARLRAILQHQKFQTIEAAWRGLDFLLRRCPDEERVRYYVLDVSPAELEAASAADLARVLRAQPCDIVVCDRTFGERANDLRALGSLARACSATNVLLLAGGTPRLAGCDGFAAHPDPDDWLMPTAPDVAAAIAALQSSPEGARVLLALPRFLLRQPYGRAGDPIDSLPFEELPNDPDHELFLWGNSAFLVAQTMIDAFAAGTPTGHLDGSSVIGDLSVARFIDHDGTAVKPCAEAWLSDRAVQRLAGCGLTPVQSERNADRVRVWPVRFGGT